MSGSRGNKLMLQRFLAEFRREVGSHSLERQLNIVLVVSCTRSAKSAMDDSMRNGEYRDLIAEYGGGTSIIQSRLLASRCLSATCGTAGRTDDARLLACRWRTATGQVARILARSHGLWPGRSHGLWPGRSDAIDLGCVYKTLSSLASLCRVVIEYFLTC